MGVEVGTIDSVFAEKKFGVICPVVFPQHKHMALFHPL